MKTRLDLKPGEGRALAWAWLYVVVLFLAYYVLRPVRDELGVSGGVENLPWLFTGTMLTILVLTPLFGWLVKHWPRERFIAVSYRFFMLNLAGFAAAMAWVDPEHQIRVGYGFFIWLSVFNLFVVSVFWSLMVDVFDETAGKRLFGLLAAGATVGGMLGSGLVSLVAEALSPAMLLLVAMVLLEVAVQAARRLSAMSLPRQAPGEAVALADGDRRARTAEATGRTDAAHATAVGAGAAGAVSADTGRAGNNRDADSNAVMGGSVFSGFTHVIRSPFLLGIAAFVLLYTVTSTVLYFEQAEIASQYFSDRSARRAFFANLDFWVNALTLVGQLVLTAGMMQRLSMSVVLMILPLLSVVGFAVLASFPTLGVFVAVQVLRRVSNFVFAKPAREVLFTQLSREDRYKAKNVIDTLVYRSGDQIGSWGYAGLSALGLGLAGMSWVAALLCVAWAWLAWWLGRRAQRPRA